MARLLIDAPGCTTHLRAPNEVALAVPCWDRQKCKLFLGEQLVKNVVAWACAQIMVLDAFESSKWVPRLDNPLPGRSRLAARRLRDTVRSLCTGMEAPLLKFEVHGEQVSWRASKTS